MEQPTRLPAYAALDIARNMDYGARRPDSRVDLLEFVTLAGVNASRGDFFDYEFRSTESVSDALDTALSVCRAQNTGGWATCSPWCARSGTQCPPCSSPTGDRPRQLFGRLLLKGRTAQTRSSRISG